VVQPKGTGSDRLQFVGQVGLGQGVLYIGWDRMGRGRGGLQIRWDRMGLGQVSLQIRWDRMGLEKEGLPAEPDHLSQSGTTRPRKITEMSCVHFTRILDLL